MSTVETIDLRFIGVSPLLMRNGRLPDPLDPHAMKLAAITGKRMKTRADHEKIAEIEWYGGLWLHKKKPCLPAEVIEAVFVDGAKFKKRGSAARAGFLVETPATLLFDGPSDLAKSGTTRPFASELVCAYAIPERCALARDFRNGAPT